VFLGLLHALQRFFACLFDFHQWGCGLYLVVCAVAAGGSVVSLRTFLKVRTLQASIRGNWIPDPV